MITPNGDLASLIAEELRSLIRMPTGFLAERIASGQMTPEEWRNLICSVSESGKRG